MNIDIENQNDRNNILFKNLRKNEDKIIYKNYEILNVNIKVKIKFYIDTIDKLCYIASFDCFSLHSIFINFKEMDESITDVFNNTFKININTTGFENFEDYIEYKKNKEKNKFRSSCKRN